jgi:hypothetical protein
MSIEKCLNDKVEAGRLTREQAEEALKHVKRLERQNAGRMSVDAATADALARAAAEMKREAEVAERQAALQILAVDRVVKEAQAHPEGMFAGVASVFARDIWGVAGHSNVEGRARAVLGTLHSMFADGLNAYRSKMAGLARDSIGLERFVRELYGENSNDATARSAATAWRDTTDYAVGRFNAAGGDLRRKEDWRLPQHWDEGKIKAAGADGFRIYMHGAFNEGRLVIRDFATGERVNPLKAAELIDEAFERIRTGGLVDLVPGQNAGTKLANRRTDARAFEWATADDWLDFNRKYGVGDAQIYDLLTGHLDGISRDIGALEILGPNPAAAARTLIDHARKDGVSDLKVYRLEALWDHVSGVASSPVSEGLASFGRGTRAWLSAAQLGSAVLSSITDFGALTATALWNGIPASRALSSYFKLLNPANEADRVLAVRAGLIADGWARRAAGATRHQTDVVGAELPGRIADFVMRASGLSGHTEAGRWAFGMEFLGHLADLAKTKFDALPASARRGFDAHGINAGDWDRIRGAVENMAGPGEPGARFVWPEKLAKSGSKADVDAAAKLMELVHTEMDFAVPTPGAIERSLLLGKTRPGTFVGEFLRGSVQYKTFPVTIMTTHLMRGVQSIRAGDHGMYLAGTTIGMTVMGAFAMQAKEIAKGKDPRDMSDAKFWGAAFAQGGGAGILGDFLYSGLNRADKSFYMTAIGGPTGGLVDDLARLTMGNVSQATAGKDTHFGAELARFVRMNTPGTSIWYTRLAMDRLIWDQLQMAIDPDYARSFARVENRARQETGQEFWWGPGDSAPARAPQLGGR